MAEVMHTPLTRRPRDTSLLPTYGLEHIQAARAAHRAQPVLIVWRQLIELMAFWQAIEVETFLRFLNQIPRFRMDVDEFFFWFHER